MRLQGKSAIVTGAAQGLGEALARRLAREGCDVLLADINLDLARQAADAIERETGRRTGATQTNVASESDVRDMVDEAVSAFGRLDILVANVYVGLAKCLRPGNGFKDARAAEEWANAGYDGWPNGGETPTISTLSLGETVSETNAFGIFWEGLGLNESATYY